MNVLFFSHSLLNKESGIQISEFNSYFSLLIGGTHVERYVLFPVIAWDALKFHELINLLLHIISFWLTLNVTSLMDLKFLNFIFSKLY